MTAKTFLKRYWRVPVVAVLGARSSPSADPSWSIRPTRRRTRLLIRGRATSFLDVTGQDLSKQPGVVDASMAKSLAETQAGLASSREVAVRVVDQLGLDQPKPAKTGPVATMARAAAWTYSHLKAWVTFGMYRQAERREKAIGTVQGNVSAHQLGTTSGGATGQPSSYVIEVAAQGDSPEQARAIANASADALVAISQERFQQDSQNYADTLQTEVTKANTDVGKAADDVSAYKIAHNISALDEQLVNNAKNASDLAAQVRQTEADLSGAQATLGSLQSSLASTDPTADSTEGIQTGRSTTNVNSTGANPVYQALQGQVSAAQSNVAALQARLSTLQGQVGGDTPTALNQDQSGLLQLENQLTYAQNNAQKLTTALNDAQANAVSGQVDLTRISEASLPTYPTSPKRYLYLLLGLLVGGLAGGGLTWLALRRQSPDDGNDDDLDLDDLDRQLFDDEINLRTQETNGEKPRTPEPVGASGGSSGRAGLFARDRTIRRPATTHQVDGLDDGMGESATR